MPILEVDLLYAATDPEDRHNKIAENILRLTQNGVLGNVKVDSLALHELELNLKSGNILINGRKPTYEDMAEFFRDLDKLLKFYEIGIFALTCGETALSAELRRRGRLTFYDSHHAAAALLYDSKIISLDTAYDRVKNLKRLDPYKIK